MKAPKYESVSFECDTSIRYDYTNSSMTENRLFLYWLTVLTKPSLIVELGTYYGCSFFAFAQAIKDHSLQSSLLGVDTWQGDEHAGFYGDEVRETFLTEFKKYQLDKAYVMQDTFASVAEGLVSECADIILIDGLHSYEAAKQDFNNFLPKLKKDGIILFHDIKVEHFTLKDYWQELKSTYDYIQVENQYGLGILFPKGSKKIKKVLTILDALNVNYVY